MKNIFTISELPHIWAWQSQSSGRTSNGSMFFHGDTIYSYGTHFPIATLLDDGVVLMTWRGYSVSTARHISKVRSAVSHKEVVYCYNPVASVINNLIDESHRVEEKLKVLENKRARPHTRAAARLALDEIIQNAKRYCEVRGTTLDFQLAIMHDDIDLEMAFEAATLFMSVPNSDDFDIDKALQERRDSLFKANEKREARLRQKNELEIEQWLKGAANTWKLNDSLTPMLLRANVERGIVETTKGARVPYAAAKLLYKAISVGEDVRGFSIGGYEVVGNDGILTIGCHKIPHEEVERFASAQGWVTDKKKTQTK